MELKEKRIKLFEKLNGKTFDYDNIPCFVESKDDIYPKYESCPLCGGEMMNVRVSSPAYYWQNRCGRECRFAICCNCGRHSDLELMKMN